MVVEYILVYVTDTVCGDIVSVSMIFMLELNEFFCARSGNDVGQFDFAPDECCVICSSHFT